MADHPLQQPDAYTIAWWKKQLSGIHQQITLLFNHSKECYDKSVDAETLVATTVTAWENERAELHAKIGELQSEIVELKDRQEKIAKWLKAKPWHKTDGD